MMRKFVAVLLAAAALTCTGQDSYAKFSFKQLFKKERSALYQDTEAIFNQYISGLTAAKNVIKQNQGTKKSIFGIKTPVAYTEALKNLKSLKSLFSDSLKAYETAQGQKTGKLIERASRGANKAESIYNYLQTLYKFDAQIETDVDALRGLIDDYKELAQRESAHTGTYSNAWGLLFNQLADILANTFTNIETVEEQVKQVDNSVKGLPPRRNARQGQRRPKALSQEDASYEEASDTQPRRRGAPGRRPPSKLND